MHWKRVEVANRNGVALGFDISKRKTETLERSKPKPSEFVNRNYPTAELNEVKN